MCIVSLYSHQDYKASILSIFNDGISFTPCSVKYKIGCSAIVQVQVFGCNGNPGWRSLTCKVTIELDSVTIQNLLCIINICMVCHSSSESFRDTNWSYQFQIISIVSDMVHGTIVIVQFKIMPFLYSKYLIFRNSEKFVLRIKDLNGSQGNCSVKIMKWNVTINT